MPIADIGPAHFRRNDCNALAKFHETSIDAQIRQTGPGFVEDRGLISRPPSISYLRHPVSNRRLITAKLFHERADAPDEHAGVPEKLVACDIPRRSFDIRFFDETIRL